MANLSFWEIFWSHLSFFSFDTGKLTAVSLRETSIEILSGVDSMRRRPLLGISLPSAVVNATNGPEQIPQFILPLIYSPPGSQDFQGGTIIRRSYSVTGSMKIGCLGDHSYFLPVPRWSEAERPDPFSLPI